MFKRSALTASIAVTMLALAACSGGDTGSTSSSDTIKIGAALPMTGSLASFGPAIQTGYQQLVDDLNADGGIEIDGELRELELVVRDSESDSNKVSEVSRSLVLDDQVVGLLGSVSPPLQVPASTVAEMEQVPFVGTLTPVGSWLAGNPEGWDFAWNFFFDEEEMTMLQYKVADLTETNKKVALFTDNAEDGTAMGALWEQNATAAGYEIVYRATFPVGTTDYSPYITELKSSDADVLVSQMIPPDAMALWKQLKASDVELQLAFAEKAASMAAWPAELGEISDGTMITDWYMPGSEQGATLLSKFSESVGENPEATASVIAYSAAKVLTDAIARAGSVDPTAVNEEIAKTSGLYPSGHVIEFGDDNASRIEPVSSQWVGNDTQQIYPQHDGVSLLTPVTGLQ